MRFTWVIGALVLALPGGASAATVELVPSDPYPETTSDVVTFTAAPGEVNHVTARAVGAVGDADGFWDVADAGAELTAGTGCIQVDTHHVKCLSTDERYIHDIRLDLGDEDDWLLTGSNNSDFDNVSAHGGDGNDHLAVGGNSGAHVSGDAGDDVLSAAPRAGSYQDWYRLDGGLGNDRLVGSGVADGLHGGGGVDELLGREGDDVLEDGDRDSADFMLMGGGHDMAAADRAPGPDRMDGGSGLDTVRYDKRTVGVSVDLALDEPAGEAREKDVVLRMESAAGGGGDDRLAGNAQANYLSGGAGDDHIIGRAGDDRLSGGHESLIGRAAAHRLSAGRGHDTIDCGPGFDSVSDVGATSFLRPGCELASANSIEPRVAYPPMTVAGVVLPLACPLHHGDEAEQQPPCAGSVRLVEAGSRHRVIAAAQIPRRLWGYNGIGPLTVRFTPIGRRLAGRAGGVRTVIKEHFRHGRRLEPGHMAWMIQLEIAR